MRATKRGARNPRRLRRSGEENESSFHFLVEDDCNRRYSITRGGGGGGLHYCKITPLEVYHRGYTRKKETLINEFFQGGILSPLIAGEPSDSLRG